MFIRGIFTSQNAYDNRIYVLISFNLVIEIDLTKEYNKGMFDNLVKTFIQENNSNPANKEKDKNKVKANGLSSNINNINPPYTITKCEYYEKTFKVIEYSVLTFNNSQTNFITGWKMPNDEIILLMHIAYMEKNKFICIVLNNGLIRLFNYSSYQIESEYKTSYGNIMSISFSDDGCLMGLGVEDDNVYIIDMLMKKVLFCLEGHHNYVSDIVFSLQKTQEEIPTKNKTFLKQISYDTIITVKTINNMQLFSNTTKNEFLKCWEDDNNDNTDKLTNKNRTDSIMNQKDIRYQQYDIYTCGLDGFICSWKIEVISQFNQFDNNETDIVDEKNKDERTKKHNYQEKILLKPYENIKNSPIYIEKINKQPSLPIVKMIKIDTVIGTISKRNVQSSNVTLNFYFGTKEKTASTIMKNNSGNGIKLRNSGIQKDKLLNNSNQSNNSTVIKNTFDSTGNSIPLNKDLKTKMDILNKTSVKIKDVYSKTFNNQNFNLTITSSINNNSPTKAYNLTNNGNKKRSLD